MQELRIGEVARLAGVSVRTLRHYDEVGLLAPGGRSDSGYRLYSGADIARLRRILFWRELDFGLDRIAEILDDAAVPKAEHLARQHRLLGERLARTEQLLRAIEHEMEADRMGIEMTPDEQLEVFAAEAEQRWGHTEAYKESQRRAATYSKAEWAEIKDQADGNLEAFARALREGAPADGTRATALADEHRRHISRWFYPCSPEMHRRLAEMYVADPRYAGHYERVEPGLAAYVRDAILAAAA